MRFIFSLFEIDLSNKYILIGGFHWGFGWKSRNLFYFQWWSTTTNQKYALDIFFIKIL